MISWTLKKFEELSLHELYELLRLRTEVFVVEQNCVFQDMDDKDHYCYHLLGRKDDKLVAYTRIVPEGISYPDAPSIGRVVTSPSARGEGLGRILMEESIKELFRVYGRSTIRIGAQLYLKKFYESLGFEQSSAVYDEDGIEHIEMIRASV
ncbi:GNAT family N-acetyltransferase [Terrimonas sp. NA20]|uniref:GNAT family N-acetyltransferase n=1 Tax=Terrimonas ginsenosidimutans TaxID=2908004 RepID=A0ABS9L0L0_9BACT|nr:GNAT family N-acetyltransferase [Terrimonas ginsenosidimutans]MCG2617994.1 GNAT family N-acetyltransferase [Terrimonas ginsenosidimutans]